MRVLKLFSRLKMRADVITLSNLTHYTSCHALGVKIGFIKGEALRLLRTNSTETKFEENICNFKSHLRVRGYPDDLVNRILAEEKVGT